MNIQKRLRLSYILMLLIPIFLILLSGGLLRRIYSYDDRENIILPESFYSQLYKIMAESPDSLMEKAVLRDLDSLSGYKDKTNIFIEKERNLVNSNINSHSGKRMNRHDNYDAVHKWSFYFSDDKPGVVILNIYDSSLVKEMFISGGVSVIVVISILILTNGLLSFFVARSIIKPIKILENAALNIKNENLDRVISYDGKDEFTKVCIAFEEMRIRLKNSLHEQLKYEENRKELLSNISHDLKTPITAIKGYIEGIQDGIADSPQKVEKYMNTVYSKTVLMNNLIDRLFLFSKLDLKRVQFNFQKISLITFMKDIIEELKFDYSDLDFQMAEEDLEIFVSADSIHLHRVFINLIDNAAKYSNKETTTVQIKVNPLKEMIEISIKDNGAGISKEALPHIFERFYRSDPARSSQTEGSGLGLSISSQIITAHGGEIKAESSFDEGTTITFTLRKAHE